MAVTLSSLAGAGAQFFDNNGVPLAGGLIYTYLAGTTTPAATYTSSTGLIAHSNPIVLNAAGRIATGEVWLTSGVDYKFIVQTSLFVQLGSYDNIPSINDFTSIYADLANTANPALGDALVGFRQSNSLGNLTSAVGRTVHQKLQESVSVKDFGAVGDGITNDSAAIQAAVNSFTASGVGGEIFFPKGTYKINTVITVPSIINELSGIRFVGVGFGSEIQAGTETTSLFLTTGRDVSFSNLYFVNTSTLTDTAIAGGGPFTNSYPGLTIDSCKFLGFNNGIGLNFTNHTITNNFFLNNTCHVSFADDGRNSYVFGNNFLGGLFGIRFRQVGANAEGVRIINNLIQITGASGVGIDATGALEMIIMGNIIDQTGVNGIAIYLHGDGTFVVDRIKVTSNWIAAGQNGYGMFVDGPNSNIECTNNSFVSNNNLTTIAGLSLEDTDTYQLIANNFLMTGGVDFGSLSITDGTVFGNSSNNALSPILINSSEQKFATTNDISANNFIFNSKVQVGTTGPSLQGGTSDPNAIVTGVVGSIFMNSGGGVGSRVYVCQGGTVWTAIAGV
jgi:polygalacturonase